MLQDEHSRSKILIIECHQSKIINNRRFFITTTTSISFSLLNNSSANRNKMCIQDVRAQSRIASKDANAQQAYIKKPSECI